MARTNVRLLVQVIAEVIKFGSLGKGMPMFTANSLVIDNQLENPENPLFYPTGGILNPEEPVSFIQTIYLTQKVKSIPSAKQR
jgi:hypothetical protein